MRIQYIEKNFRDKSLALLYQVDYIMEEYKSRGYSLTLRQVYYQLVARDIIPNTERSYKNLGSLITDGRMAGILNWEGLEDRTRVLQKYSHWDTPKDLLGMVPYWYQVDRWKNQPYYVEVWVEKDALIDVVGQACRPLDVPHLSCRGYFSVSGMWRAAQRFLTQGKPTVILHLGDHDPSGIDMSRDIQARMEVFGVYDLIFERIALNIDQVRTYNPPPNPAKVTDSRYTGYVSQHGPASWELDALDPDLIVNLVQSKVSNYISKPILDQDLSNEASDKVNLRTLSDNYDLLTENMEDILSEYGYN